MAIRHEIDKIDPPEPSVPVITTGEPVAEPAPAEPGATGAEGGPAPEPEPTPAPEPEPEPESEDDKTAARRRRS